MELFLKVIGDRSLEETKKKTVTYKTKTNNSIFKFTFQLNKKKVHNSTSKLNLTLKKIFKN